MDEQEQRRRTAEINEQHRFNTLVFDLEIKSGLSHTEAERIARQTLYPETQSRWEKRTKPEILLEDEYKRQASKMAQLFARTLNMSEEEYIASIPPFPDRPNRYLFGMSDWQPLIVEGGRIPWEKQARLSGIVLGWNMGISSVYDHHMLYRKTPETVFTTWIAISSHYDFFAGNGGTVLEGIAFWNAYPEDTRNGIFDFPGSRVSLGSIPYLNCQSFKFGKPELNSYIDGDLWRPRCHTLISSRG